MRTGPGAVATVLALALATAALAQGQGKGQGRGNPPGQAQPMPTPAPAPRGTAGVSVSIGVNDQVAIRQHYRQQAARGVCPPGLARKNNGCMPPGQARKWAIGAALPVGVAYYPVPTALVRRLSPAPPGYLYVQVGPDVLLMGAATRMIIGAVAIF